MRILHQNILNETERTFNAIDHIVFFLLFSSFKSNEHRALYTVNTVQRNYCYR